MAPELPERLLPKDSVKELNYVIGLPKRKQLFVVVERINPWYFWKSKGTGKFLVTKTGDFKILLSRDYTFASITRGNRECFIEARTPEEAFDKFIGVKKWPNLVLFKENEKYLRAG